MAIHSPHGPGQLIGMSASFDDQGRGNQRYRMVNRDSQPKIVIFADRQALVEPSDLFEKLFGHHDRRWAYTTQVKTPSKNISRRFAVLLLWIDSDPVSQPDFFSLTDLDFRMLLHERRLDFQFLRQPEIVRIQKRHVPPLRDHHTVIAPGGYTFSRLRDDPHS